MELVPTLPAGIVLPFAGNTVPGGYLLCDGAQVSRTNFAALFAAIGTAHGNGNGATTFHLPDYRGRFLRGVDGTAGADPDKATRSAMNAGGNTANAVGSVQADAYLSHTHLQNAHSHSQAISNSSGATATIVQGYIGTAPIAANPTNISSTVAVNQNSGGSETRPKNANVNYIIKV